MVYYSLTVLVGKMLEYVRKFIEKSGDTISVILQTVRLVMKRFLYGILCFTNLNLFNKIIFLQICDYNDKTHDFHF